MVPHVRVNYEPILMSLPVTPSGSSLQLRPPTRCKTALTILLYSFGPSTHAPCSATSLHKTLSNDNLLPPLPRHLDETSLFRRISPLSLFVGRPRTSLEGNT